MTEFESNLLDSLRSLVDSLRDSQDQLSVMATALQDIAYVLSKAHQVPLDE